MLERLKNKKVWVGLGVGALSLLSVSVLVLQQSKVDKQDSVIVQSDTTQSTTQTVVSDETSTAQSDTTETRQAIEKRHKKQRKPLSKKIKSHLKHKQSKK